MIPSWLNLANALTAVRLVAAPLIVAAILQERPWLAAAIFFLAAVTDSLDGWAARRTNAVTTGGAYLDPIADKVFLGSVILALAAAGNVPWWYAGIVFGRDALILLFGLAALLFTSYRKFAPSLWGKASTFFQILTVVSVLVRNAWPAPFPTVFAAAALPLSTAVTVFSGIHYAWRAARSRGGGRGAIDPGSAEE